MLRSDKTAKLRMQLQEHEQEHNRLLELIQRLKAELEAKLAELEGLRRHGQPNKQCALPAFVWHTKHLLSCSCLGACEWVQVCSEAS